jgi:hypothetical protein
MVFGYLEKKNSLLSQEENIETEQEQEQEQESKERETYEQYLRDIFHKLNESGLDWRLLGGVALDFYLKNAPRPRRPDGSIRDLDIIVLDVTEEAGEKVNELYQSFRKEMKELNRDNADVPVYPEVNLCQVKNSQYLENKDNHHWQMFPHILRDGSRFFLQFRDILEEVDSRVFEPQTLQIETENGVLSSPSLKLETIIHSYLIRIGGHIKNKDLDKIKKFLKKAHRENVAEEDHRLYLPYHRFAKKVRKKYNLTTKLCQLYNLIDYKLFNSSLSHKVIPAKLIRAIEEL